MAKRVNTVDHTCNKPELKTLYQLGTDAQKAQILGQFLDIFYFF